MKSNNSSIELMENDLEKTRPVTPPLDLEDTKPEKPLPALENTVISKKTVFPQLRVAQRCDVGAVRERNEDACLLFTAESGGHFARAPMCLAVVADGMGGHENGHMASKSASRTAAEYVLRKIYLPLLGGADVPDPASVHAIMHTAVLTAHTAVSKQKNSDSGTTLTMTLILENQLFVAHVGDSRAYWLVENHFEAITVDHSLVQRLQDEGKLTTEEAENYQYRNILLRALGQVEDLEVDTYQRELPAKGKLLLCSDGLCGLVKDERLGQILGLDADPHRIADLMVDAALVSGGYDNITAVVIDFVLQRP